MAGLGLGLGRPSTVSSFTGQAHETGCFRRWCFRSASMPVSGEGLSQKLAVLLVVLKYLERVHLDKNQPQMLFLIDSVPGGFCGSKGCRYISAMFLNVPVCHWASFSPLPLIFPAV